MQAENPTLRGTLTWIAEARCGILYIFLATQYQVELLGESPEGQLRWHRIGDLHNLQGLGDHQEFFLHKILSDEKYFYSGIAAYDNGVLVQYADSDRYQAGRLTSQ